MLIGFKLLDEHSYDSHASPWYLETCKCRIKTQRLNADKKWYIFGFVPTLGTILLNKHVFIQMQTTFLVINM